MIHRLTGWLRELASALRTGLSIVFFVLIIVGIAYGLDGDLTRTYVAWMFAVLTGVAWVMIEAAAIHNCVHDVRAMQHFSTAIPLTKDTEAQLLSAMGIDVPPYDGEEST